MVLIAWYRDVWISLLGMLMADALVAWRWVVYS
jgi:hypothetical protein